MARAPKKEKYLSDAPQEVYGLLHELIEKHHDDLGDSHIIIKMRHGGWKAKGKMVFGKFAIFNELYRQETKKDAALILNADAWAVMKPNQKRYILDHQLYSLEVSTNKDGDIKEAADGRPILKSIPPDIEAFNNVIRRHGIAMDEIKSFSKALDEAGQLTIEDVTASSQESQEPAGHADSDPDEEYDERRQVTLEQAAAAADDPMDGVDPHSVPF
ncbi:hypothetical protein HGI30_14925 [Paenibacillus albicereus]|uniref:Putative phage metallopeptidase domain-containing protein n=1 Tax=Paenibacillus albicereus TaxID=2726185 RepID=A0A6H2GZ94_9BACL|nr:putative metallopeptidase [Paenibacillus albicereus]QJC52725.1 hypothetical protein HGI30_14925 [Paenibacillus albicereus]